MNKLKEYKRLTEDMVRQAMEEISKKGIKHEFIFIVFKDNWYKASIDREVFKQLNNGNQNNKQQ